MAATPDFTLDQLRVLVAIADAGSFGAAAKRLKRAQGAVSYNVQALEDVLGIELFERSGRRSILTEAGRAMVAEARTLLSGAEQFGARALGMEAGLEPALTLAVDAIFPPRVVAEVISEFQKQYPTVTLTLKIGTLGEVLDDVDAGLATLGVTGIAEFGQGLVQRPSLSVELVSVVAPGHPLARCRGEVADAELARHVHLVLSDRSERDAKKHAFLAQRVWRVSDLHARLELLRAGLGWARMPRDRVAADLRQKRLVTFRLARWGKRPMLIDMSVVYKKSLPLGPAGRWMVERLTELAKSSENTRKSARRAKR